MEEKKRERKRERGKAAKEKEVKGKEGVHQGKGGGDLGLVSE